jgi:hypothetical protein
VDADLVQSTRVHIVVIAWLFVTFTMALTLRSAVAGIALFVVLGLGPVLLLAMLAAKRVRSRRERATPSVRERDVHAPDHADAERDP